jgi:hypothetical protein
MLDQLKQRLSIIRRRPPRRCVSLVTFGPPDRQQPFTLKIQRRRWPPFYATSFFLPRLRVSLENGGDDLPEGTTIELRLRPYSGPLEGAPGPDDEGWWEAVREIVWDEWKAKTARHFKLRVPSSALPADATYIACIFIVVMRPGGFKMEPATRQIVPTSDVSTGVRADSWLLNDYFRVEPLSSVLTFLLVGVTFLLVLATLALAIGA